MKNKSLFAHPITLSFFTFITEILALVLLYIIYTDEFLHSLLFLFLYLILFIFCFLLSSAFKTGKKELVKTCACSIFNICFVFHAMAFVDMISLNHYYFFTGNFFKTCIGIIAMLLFVLFTITFFNHLAINSTNESKTEGVSNNKTFLLVIAILSLLQAGLITYTDYVSGRTFEWYLIVSYAMFFFISFILICIETLINEFRLARERGELASYATNLVGKKAAATAMDKQPVSTTTDKKPTTTKTNKKTTKKPKKTK